jgi:hypothetical protein
VEHLQNYREDTVSVREAVVEEQGFACRRLRFRDYLAWCERTGEQELELRVGQSCVGGSEVGLTFDCALEVLDSGLKTFVIQATRSEDALQVRVVRFRLDPLWNCRWLVRDCRGRLVMSLTLNGKKQCANRPNREYQRTDGPPQTTRASRGGGAF